MSATEFDHGDLKVSPNHRFLMYADGTPFFYLGDTAWELFHRLTLQESKRYLDDRAGKNFNVIQAVVLAEFDGTTASTCLKYASFGLVGSSSISGRSPSAFGV
jgi:hypothetical protein